MKDKLLEAMKSPHCLAGIVPDHGGMWVSPCRPGVVYPSATPRNFATEPATWSDYESASESIDADDFEFILNFDKFSSITDRKIFGHNNATASVSLTQTSNPKMFVTSFRGIVTGNADEVYIKNIPVISTNTLVIRRVNGQAKITMNDVVVATAAGNPVPFTPRGTGTAITSDFDGNILSATLCNLTSKKTVWSYPSEAERVRLLTYSNVRTDRGVFEAADTAAASRVDTPLSLEGMTSVTVFFRYRAVTRYASNQYAFGVGQGTDWSASLLRVMIGTDMRLNTTLRAKTTENISSVININLPQNLALASPGDHVVAVSLDNDGRLSIFFDGKRVHTQVISEYINLTKAGLDAIKNAKFYGFYSTIPESFGSICIGGTAVFDYAMTADEIKALS